MRISPIALVALLVAACGSSGGDRAPDAPPVRGGDDRPASFRPTKAPVQRSIEFFGRTYPGESPILLVAKAVDESQMTWAKYCEAGLTKRLNVAGMKIYDPARVTLMREALRAEMRVQGKTPHEVVELLKQFQPKAMITVWLVSTSGEAFRGSYRGDAALSLQVVDPDGRVFGTWRSEPFSNTNPWPVENSSQTARQAAVNAVLEQLAFQLGLTVDRPAEASSGGASLMSLGSPRTGERMSIGFDLGYDEKSGKLYFVDESGVVVLDGKSLRSIHRIPVPGGIRHARFCIPRRMLVAARGSTVSVVNLDFGSVRTHGTPSDVEALDVALSGDAVFGLENGGVAVLPYGRPLMSGGRGDGEGIRAVGIAGATGTVADVWQPDKGQIEIGIRGRDLRRRGRTIHLEGRGGRGLVRILSPKGVGIGRAADVVVVAVREVTRSLRRGRQTVSGYLLIANVPAMTSRRLEGAAYADAEAIALHPRSSRFCAIGNEYTNADYGILSIIDVSTGAQLDSVKVDPGVKRLAFSTPQGAFLCGQDSKGRIFVYPVKYR